MSEMKRINNITRHHGIKFVAAGVRGVCGLIFNDFLDQHHVIDVDGESRKEVSTIIAFICISIIFLFLFACCRSGSDIKYHIYDTDK